MRLLININYKFSSPTSSPKFIQTENNIKQL